MWHALGEYRIADDLMISSAPDTSKYIDKHVIYASVKLQKVTEQQKARFLCCSKIENCDEYVSCEFGPLND